VYTLDGARPPVCRCCRARPACAGVPL